MTFRRLSDYTGITIWVVTMVFTFGILYSQQKSNTKEIEKAQVYKVKINEIVIDLERLHTRQDYQQKWQAEFMTTFKDMVSEIKKTNSEVIRNTYSLKSIDARLSQESSAGMNR